MLSPKSRTWRRLIWCAPLPAVVLGLAACGGGGGKSGSATGGVAGTTAKQVTVTESDYTIQLSTMTLQPGQTTFVAMNKGRVPHSLEIDGPAVSDKRIVGTIAPGSSKSLTVTLKSGSYEIYCPVDGHKSLGMDVHVRVGSTAPGAGTSTNSGTKKGGGGY